MIVIGRRVRVRNICNKAVGEGCQSMIYPGEIVKVVDVYCGMLEVKKANGVHDTAAHTSFKYLNNKEVKL